MSGGSYDYVSFKFEEAASTLRRNHADEPHVIALADHIDAIAKVMHDIEWADSSDTIWNDELDAKIRALLGPGPELMVILARAEQLQRGLAAGLLAHADVGGFCGKRFTVSGWLSWCTLPAGHRGNCGVGPIFTSEVRP